MGLLNYITATSLDEDYAHVHQQRLQRGAVGPQTRPGRFAVGVLLVFGLLIATAGVRTSRTAGATERSHESLVAQVNDAKQELESSRVRLAQARQQTASAQRVHGRATADRTAGERQVSRLGAIVGATAVTGPGVRLVADDAPDAAEDAQTVLDKDLRNIVNGLWEAGAEAIAVNGQRITTTSAIRGVDVYITVNYAKVFAPYTVLAIGDSDTLPARFVESTSGARWLSTQQTVGLRFDMRSEESMTLPAVAPERLTLHYASTKADQVEEDS